MNDQLITIQLEHTQLKLLENGIVQVNATDHTYSVKDIHEIHASAMALSNGKKALLLLMASEYTSIDSDVRAFLSTPEAGKNSIAEAYVIHSLAQRLLMNFLTKVTGTPVPVRFFSERHLALQWLNSFK